MALWPCLLSLENDLEEPKKTSCPHHHYPEYSRPPPSPTPSPPPPPPQHHNDKRVMRLETLSASPSKSLTTNMARNFSDKSIVVIKGTVSRDFNIGFFREPVSLLVIPNCRIYILSNQGLCICTQGAFHLSINVTNGIPTVCIHLRSPCENIRVKYASIQVTREEVYFLAQKIKESAFIYRIFAFKQYCMHMHASEVLYT